MKSEINIEAEIRNFWYKINSSMQNFKNCEKHENFRKYHDAAWFSDNYKQTASFWFWTETKNNAQIMKDNTNTDKQ